jgi:hypothetical protein
MMKRAGTVIVLTVVVLAGTLSASPVASAYANYGGNKCYTWDSAINKKPVSVCLYVHTWRNGFFPVFGEFEDGRLEWASLVPGVISQIQVDYVKLWVYYKSKWHQEGAVQPQYKCADTCNTYSDTYTTTDFKFCYSDKVEDPPGKFPFPSHTEARFRFQWASNGQWSTWKDKNSLDYYIYDCTG